MGKPVVNAIVGGPSKQEGTSLYKTIIIKSNLELGIQIIEPNTKYIFKYNFDLEGKTLTIPENCILQFDGGSLKNGTLVGNNTILLFDLDLDEILNNIVLEGTFVYKGAQVDEESLHSEDGVLSIKDNGVLFKHLNSEIIDSYYTKAETEELINTVEEKVNTSLEKITAIEEEITTILGEIEENYIEINKNIESATNVGTQITNENLVVESNYIKGDIFYINEIIEEEKIMIKYYVAKSDGHSGDSLTDTTLFDNSYSSVEILEKSCNLKYVTSNSDNLVNYYKKSESDIESDRQKNIAAIMAISTLPGCTNISIDTTNPEWKLVYIDSEDKILLGKRTDNTWYVADDLDSILDAAINGYNDLQNAG